MLHFHSKDRSPLIFLILQSGKYYFLFFNQHRNTNYLRLNFFIKKLYVPFARVLIRYYFMSAAPNDCRTAPATPGLLKTIMSMLDGPC